MTLMPKETVPRGLVFIPDDDITTLDAGRKQSMGSEAFEGLMGQMQHSQRARRITEMTADQQCNVLSAIRPHWDAEERIQCKVNRTTERRRSNLMENTVE